MNKYIVTGIFVALLILAITLPGCSPQAKVYNDPSTNIETSVNGEFIISLEANQTTGYKWIATYDTNVFNIISEDYKTSSSEQNLVGAGGTQSFTFKALKNGSHDITMTYHRPWEPSYPQDELKTFKVTIK